MVEYAFVVTCPGFSAYGMISFFSFAESLDNHAWNGDGLQHQLSFATSVTLQPPPSAPPYCLTFFLFPSHFLLVSLLAKVLRRGKGVEPLSS